MDMKYMYNVLWWSHYRLNAGHVNRVYLYLYISAITFVSFDHYQHVENIRCTQNMHLASSIVDSIVNKLKI